MTTVDMATKIPILVYHRVHADDETTVPADEGRVDLSEFRRQMQYLADSGARVVTHREIADWLLDGAELPGRAVAIDFDDNRLNVFENAFPILREHSFCATVFTITDLADGKVVFGPQDYPAMQWHQLATLRDAGWCIAPHTQRHLWLAGPERGSPGRSRNVGRDGRVETAGRNKPRDRVALLRLSQRQLQRQGCHDGSQTVSDRQIMGYRHRRALVAEST